MTDPSALVERLTHPDAGVRRIAALDLARAERDPGVEAVLLARLRAETDEKVAVLIVRALRANTSPVARSALWSLYADPTTPASLAHAAILAHDEAELRGTEVDQRNSEENEQE